MLSRLLFATVGANNTQISSWLAGLKMISHVVNLSRVILGSVNCKMLSKNTPPGVLGHTKIAELIRNKTYFNENELSSVLYFCRVYAMRTLVEVNEAENVTSCFRLCIIRHFISI